MPTVPVAGTDLRVVDTPGDEPALVFLNGGFASLNRWRPVLGSLAGRYRTVQFEARTRRRSGAPVAYSIGAAVDDVARVVEATGVRRPVLVGWSYGATAAVRYAAEHPDDVAGLVLVDGAWPVSVLDGDPLGQAGRFGRLGRVPWWTRAAAAVGLAAPPTPAEIADFVLDMDAVNGELAADFAALTCPATFVLGSGDHAPAGEAEMQRMRSAAAWAAEGAKISVFAVAPGDQARILSRSPDLVVAAIDDVVSQAW
jgi:pimeloyl-ACP methyl ester carboxylesterase